MLIKKTFVHNVINIHSDQQGRKLLINTKLNNNDDIYTFVNIYAPANAGARSDFLKNMYKWLRQYSVADNQMIVSGDFNSVLNACDRVSKNTDPTTKLFRKFVEQNNLLDIWKTNYKPSNDCYGYTWIDPADSCKQSRIDYILCSPLIANWVKECTVKPAPVPDHKAIITVFNCTKLKRGPSYWKFNASFLNDPDYVKTIEDIFEQTILSFSGTLTKPYIWELLKCRFKEFSMSYGIEKKRNIVNEKISWEKEINEIESKLASFTDTDKIISFKQRREVLKANLENFYVNRAKGYQIRSRAKWIEEGEKSTSYFLRLEKKHQIYNTIEKLKISNGQTTTNNDDILEEAVNFYQKLYTSSLPDPQFIDTYLENINFPSRLDNIHAGTCDGLISLNECTSSVQILKRNKSPGLDGLTAEFYQHFWYLFGQFLVEVYNESFSQGRLTESQNTSVLSLIFKKSDRTLLKNYRPLSLTNVDYKILAMVLACRLQKVIHNIISPEQTACIKGRYIGTNIRLIEDLIEYTTRHNISGYLIFLDFEKAYDSLEIIFATKVLQKFNFGEDFVNWVSLLYNRPRVIIKNNGYLSRPVIMSRGIRQGCPISSMIFILATEVLALSIKQNVNIKGIQIGNKSHKLSQYADDTTLCPKDKNDIRLSIQEVKEFGKHSGLNLNLSKSQGLPLGPNRQIDMNNFQNIKWAKIDQPIRYLGIFVGHDKIACMKLNWTSKIEEMQKLLDCWRSRDLTLFGKITIIKCLALSKLVHSAQNTEYPEEIGKNITKMFFDFIWNKNDRIKRATVIAPIEKGGLNMVDIESFFLSLKATWMDRIFSDTQNTWSSIIKKYLEDIAPLCLLRNMKLNSLLQSPFIKRVPKFYQQVFIGYTKSKIIIKPTNIQELLQEQIWGNLLFTTYKQRERKHTTLLFRSWIDCNIYYLSDIKFVNGKIDVPYIYNKLTDKRNFHIEIRELNIAISQFRPTIADLNHNPTDLPVRQNNAIDEVHTNSPPNSKMFYKNLILKKIETPSFKYWGSKIGTEHFVLENIDNIFKNKVINIKEKKLAEFNYKVLFNIIPTGKFLSKFVPNIEANCDICGITEDLEHLLFSCKLSKPIWNLISSHMYRNLQVKDILCGVQNCMAFNYCTTLVAFIIYKYRIISRNENSTRTPAGLISLISADVNFRISIYALFNNKIIKPELVKLKNVLNTQPLP